MKIVVEYSLFISILLNFLILKLSSHILKCKTRLVMLSAMLGAVISILQPLLKMGVTLKICLQILILILMTVITFDFVDLKSFVSRAGIILIITLIFGGACELLRSLIGDFPLFVVMLIAFVTFIFCKLLFKYIERTNKIKQFTYDLKIIDGEKVLFEQGYLDSGNVLVDQITKKPIVLINFEVFHKLYNEISYLTAFTKTYDFKSIKNAHHIKINGVGGGGNILVFTVDELQVGEEKSFKDVVLGLSFSGFEKSFKSKVLLNCGFI